MGRRTLLLIASILVAAVGTALIFLYVRGATDRANQDASLVPVVVAKSDIPAGTSVQDVIKKNLYAVAERRSGDLPADSFPSVAELNKFASSKTLGGLSARSFITAHDLAAPGQAAAAGIPDGKVAQSIQLPDPNRVAGIIKPGVQVAVMATYTDPATKKLTALWLMSEISVIAVGSDGATSGTTGAVAPQIIDLAVNFDQATQLRLAEQNGELSLVVLPAKPTAAPRDPTTQLQYTDNE